MFLRPVHAIHPNPSQPLPSRSHKSLGIGTSALYNLMLETVSQALMDTPSPSSDVAQRPHGLRRTLQGMADGLGGDGAHPTRMFA